MSQNHGIETVEEFLARGGKIQKIETGESGDPALKFNNIPLDERIRAQKKKTYLAAQKSLRKQVRRG